MTTPIPRIPPLPTARASAHARDAHPHGASAHPPAPPHAPARAGTLALARGPAIATVLWGALVLGVDARQARAPRAHKAASAPSTEQILAPSAATVPDALPPDQRVWRCGSSYSARPCTGPDTKPVDVADTRSDAQRRQSEELTARDKRLAAWYEAGRRQRETSASAPAPSRAPAASAACVDTTMMHCVPNKPRSRKLTTPGRKAMAGRRS
ncbi:MAG: hypothetical protein JF586_05690 [Burkholderiales bacterium]|nr:hypothetical protein [Burkholderiales bacterium]